MRVDVDVSGPLFDGRGPAFVETFLREAQRDVGAAALSEVQDTLNRRIRNPTPYYEVQVTSERRGDIQVVHDRKIIYGPWLEGVGSRNKTTRFKGYRAFRLAHQEIEGRVPALVRHSLDTLAARLDG